MVHCCENEIKDKWAKAPSEEYVKTTPRYIIVGDDVSGCEWHNLGFHGICDYNVSSNFLQYS